MDREVADNPGEAVAAVAEEVGLAREYPQGVGLLLIQSGQSEAIAARKESGRYQRFDDNTPKAARICEIF